MYVCKWVSTVINCSRYSRVLIRIETLDFRIYTTKQYNTNLVSKNIQTTSPLFELETRVYTFFFNFDLF